MRGRYALALALGSLGSLAAHACSSPAELPLHPGGAGGNFVGDAGMEDASDAQGGSPPVGDGGPPAPVWVSVEAVGESGLPGGADAFEAGLAALALGGRAVVVARDWNELADAAGTPNASALASLADEIALHVAAGRQVVVDVLAARRSVDLRPTDLALQPWGDSAVVAAYANLAGQILASAPDGSALGIGREADAMLELDPDFGNFAIGVRAALAGAPPVVLGFTAGALLAQPRPDQPMNPVLMLASTFDLVRVEYVPTDASGASPLALGDALFGAVPEKPFFLEIGASSAIGEAEQAAFHAELRTLVGAYRARFPYLHLVRHRDLEGPGCDAFATWQGLDPASPEAAALCAAGVTSADGGPKPALGQLLQTVAVFAAP